MKAPPPEFFSDTGFIVDDVAAGFLYLTNSGIGIIDGYISNAMADKFDRDNAVNLITMNLIASARTAGIKLLKCDSQNKKVINRAKDHGFREIGLFTSLVKEM